MRRFTLFTIACYQIALDTMLNVMKKKYVDQPWDGKRLAINHILKGTKLPMNDSEVSSHKTQPEGQTHYPGQMNRSMYVLPQNMLHRSGCRPCFVSVMLLRMMHCVGRRRNQGGPCLQENSCPWSYYVGVLFSTGRLCLSLLSR